MCLVFLIFSKLSHHYQGVNDRRDNSVFKTDLLTYQQVMARAVNGDFTSSGTNPVTGYSSAFTKRANQSNFVWIANLILFAIAAVSVINVLTVIYSVRSYSLLNLNAKQSKPKGSNVVRQDLSHGPQKGIFLSIMSYFEEHSYYETDLELDDSYVDPYPNKYIEKSIWVLKVWDPSPFQLYLACSLSPIVLFTIWLVSFSVSIWKLALFVIITNLSAFYVVHKFFQLISDKQIVYQETFNEYNRKYVIPKTCVLKKNAAIDATCGPMALPENIVHDDIVGHLQEENVFVTHDLNGQRHKTVRADLLAQSNDDHLNRSPSPSRRHDPFTQNSFNRPFLNEGSRLNYNDSSSHYNNIAQSTPYRRQGFNDSYSHRNDTFSRGYDNFSKNFDSFSRQSSQIHSPMRSPARFPYNANLSFDQRTQLSPSRSSRQLSPQRSPSPSKRPWH